MRAPELSLYMRQAVSPKKRKTVGAAITKHYYAGAMQVAVRDSTLYFILVDHLGSPVVTTYSGGSRTADLKYLPYGLDRYEYGTQRTDYRFTSQRVEDSVDLYFYGARWYDPVVGRFLQPDTIIPEPGNPQALNRYTYVYNNPLGHLDPTGHDPVVTGNEDTKERPEPKEPEPEDYNSQLSAQELYWLMYYQWFLGLLPQGTIWGPEYAMTQDVKAMLWPQFLQAWERSKFDPNFTWQPPTIDERTSGLHIDPKLLVKGARQFVEQHIVDGLGSLLGFNYSTTPGGQHSPVNGTVGSVDFIFVVPDPDNSTMLVMAANESTWTSLLRIPSTSIGMPKNFSSFVGGLGSPCWQVFYWRVPNPGAGK